MQVDIIEGIYTDSASDYRSAYPVNMIAVPKATGISNAYLRPADGIIEAIATTGLDRGGINWNGNHYRVIGTDLVRINADDTVTTFGSVGGTAGQKVTFDYSFDRLAIRSDTDLFYFDGALTQVTDPDLGPVIDFVWVDGYFMTTDGENLVVTELSDPTAVNPLKYGSSEVDPDPILALFKIRNEVYAVNRHTIEVFDNVGGEFFPFQRIDGAQIQAGAIGTFACCVFNDAVAFLGGGRNEPISVYIGQNGQSAKISTQEIDKVLKGYPEYVLRDAILESRTDENHQLLYIHLPEQTLVYDLAASQVLKKGAWHVLSSGETSVQQYLGRNFTWVNNRWYCGHPNQNKIGYLTKDIASHWGQRVAWEFSTMIFYNESMGAIFHAIELVGLSGRQQLGVNTEITTRYSTNGVTWSQPKKISSGSIGTRDKRLKWLRCGFMRASRIQKFYGHSDSMLSVSNLEITVEALAS